MMSDLTRAQRSLLDIVVRNEGRTGFVPRIDRAHPKHQPTLHVLRAMGLITYSFDSPRLLPTAAGRAEWKRTP